MRMYPMAMEQKRKKMDREPSFKWARRFIRDHEKHTNMLIEKFESSYSNLAAADADETPVNILCLDGGGMRGYAIPVLLQTIDEKYGKGKRTDILDHFDLVAGTSVGGCFALACNQMRSLQDVCDEFTDTIDEIGERTFPNRKVKTLLKTGVSVVKKHQMEAIFKERWGDAPLLNPIGRKAMAIAAAQIISDDTTTKTGKTRSESSEPFVLRSYDYPKDGDTDASAGVLGNNDPLVASSSASFTAAQASAATTALPGVAHSVKGQLNDGREVSLMDGGLYGNCPLHVAIDEARRLFPRRPLGVVLSIGYNDTEDAYINRVVQAARHVSPDLHFHRLTPSHITADFKIVETSIERVVEMEEKVREFILADSDANSEVSSSALDVTMKMLYSNQLLTPGHLRRQATPGHLRRQALMKNSKFHQRARSRKMVRENYTKKKNSSSSQESTFIFESASTHRDSYLSSIEGETEEFHTISLKNKSMDTDSAISLSTNIIHLLQFISGASILGYAIALSFHQPDPQYGAAIIVEVYSALLLGASIMGFLGSRRAVSMSISQQDQDRSSSTSSTSAPPQNRCKHLMIRISIQLAPVLAGIDILLAFILMLEKTPLLHYIRQKKQEFFLSDAHIAFFEKQIKWLYAALFLSSVSELLRYCLLQKLKDHLLAYDEEVRREFLMGHARDVRVTPSRRGDRNRNWSRRRPDAFDKNDSSDNDDGSNKMNTPLLSDWHGSNIDPMDVEDVCSSNDLRSSMMDLSATSWWEDPKPTPDDQNTNSEENNSWFSNTFASNKTPSSAQSSHIASAHLQEWGQETSSIDFAPVDGEIETGGTTSLWDDTSNTVDHATQEGPDLSWANET